VQRSLRERRRPVGNVLHGLSGFADGLGSRDGRGLGRAAKLLDAPLDLARMSLRLAQVSLQALLVRGTGGHLDVRGERGLELLLLAVRLVQVLNELRVSNIHVRHGMAPFVSSRGR